MFRLIALARRLDPALLLTLALLTFAIWPLLYRTGLPNGDDVLYHIYRTAEMDRTWSHGVIFPHWAESFYTGYGAPLFHYYAPFTYDAAAALMRVFGQDALNALRLLIALSVYVGGVGMVTFARRFAGRVGGVIAALTYAYSPYILFTEPYSRGAYPEMLAFGLFPIVMAAFSRLQHNPSRFSFLLAAFGVALLILTHNLMAVVLGGLLAGWLVWSLFTVGTGPIRPHLLALLAAMLGVGLAAWFWLPVLAEASAVRLENLTAVAELNFRAFFVPLNHLLAQSPRLDAGAFNGLEHRLNLGLPQWLLAASGLIGALVLRQRGPLDYRSLRPALYFALSGLLFIGLMLPAAIPLWEAIHPLSTLQFPWRLLGPAAFALAVLAGFNARWLDRLPARLATVLTATVIVSLIALASPLLYVTEWIHETIDSSVAAYHQAEVAGLQRATTFSNEYLPRAVLVEPDATSRLLADYADGYPVNKAHLEVLPPGVTVELLDHGPQHDRWRVRSDRPFTFEVLTFDFPGWTAAVDGEPTTITPSNPHGLITFPVPAGEHIVNLALGSTPARDLGGGMTVLALVLLGLTVLRIGHLTQQLPVPSLNASARYGLLAGGALAALFLVVYLRESGAWVNTPVGSPPLLAEHPLDYRLGDRIRLLGYDLNGTTFHPGDRVELTIYWLAEAPIPYGYSTFVHLTTGGPPAAQADKLNPAGLPTKIWPSTGFIHDDYIITLPADIPPGEYQLVAGLYTCDTRPPGDCGNGDRLPVLDSNGGIIGDVAPLAHLIISP